MFWLTEEIHALRVFHVYVGISLQEQQKSVCLCFSEIKKQELQGVEKEMAVRDRVREGDGGGSRRGGWRK